MSTVLRYIASWRERGSKDTRIAVEIPDDVRESIRRALCKSAQDATEELRIKSEEAAIRETEVLEALSGCEAKIAVMEKDLPASRDQVADLRQLREKESAVAAETISELRGQISKLEQKKEYLAREGEAARTEAKQKVLANRWF